MINNEPVTGKEAQLPIAAFSDSKEFEAWLEKQAESSDGLWIKFAKKASGIQGISKQQAIDIALCYGWIDGQLDKFDANYFLTRFTPRRPRSKWSQINRARALKLLGEGRMTPRGLAEIELAKTDGRWDAAYAPASKAGIPDDLRDALERNTSAKATFAELDRQNRYAILYRIQDTRKSETRAARIEKYVGMLERGETLYPRKKS